MQGTQKPLADTDRGNMLEEPGAEDNRLTLDPSDPRWAKTISEWQDGANYTLSNVKIQQMAPGDFRILSFQAGDGASEEAAETDPNEEVDGGKANDLSATGYPNPAVARLMDEQEKR